MPMGLPATPQRRTLDPAVYARVFEGHAEGVQVLEELCAVFARGATLKGGIDAILATYHSQGQRSVIEFIVNKINTANGAPDDDEPE